VNQFLPDKLLLVIACSHACVDWSSYCFCCQSCCYSSYLEYANKQQLASFLPEEICLPRLMSGLWLLSVLMIPPAMLRSGIPGSVLLHSSPEPGLISPNWPGHSLQHTVSTPSLVISPSCPVLKPLLGGCFGKKSWPATTPWLTVMMGECW
jgi:hypothetical protein